MLASQSASQSTIRINNICLPRVLRYSCSTSLYGRSFIADRIVDYIHHVVGKFLLVPDDCEVDHVVSLVPNFHYYLSVLQVP